jgi:hypothetical protein
MPGQAVCLRHRAGHVRASGRVCVGRRRERDTWDRAGWPHAPSDRPRCRLMDRHDIASSATERLAGELRTAEQRLSHRLRVAHIWATKVLLEEYAEQRAAELRAAQAKVEILRNDLLGLSYAPFPSQQGPTPLNHDLLTLLRSPQPSEPTLQDLQPYKDRWLAAHRALMDDPDAELDD